MRREWNKKTEDNSRKHRLYVTSSCLTVMLSLALSACSPSSGTDAEGTLELNQDCYEAYQELDAGNWDKAIQLFQQKTQGKNPEYVALVGLAKAQIGKEDWAGALETLDKAVQFYSDEEMLYLYKGDVEYRTGEYDKASESYYHAAKLDIQKNPDPDSKQAFSRSDAYEIMLASFEKSKDQNQVYEYAKELYRLDTSESGCLRSILWGASLLGTDEAKEEVREMVKGQKQETIIADLMDASEALKQGDKEKAQQILFDSDNTEEADMEDMIPLYVGYQDGSDGTMSVVSLEYVFGEPGAMIGPMKDKKWEGDCVAWIGYEEEYLKDGAALPFENSYYTGSWSGGLPEGTITYQNEIGTKSQETSEKSVVSKEEAEISFSKGMAQGRVETRCYENWDGKLELDSTSIREYKDGEMQEFSANTEDGPMMVYEYIKYSDGTDDYDDSGSDTLIWDENIGK